MSAARAVVDDTGNYAGQLGKSFIYLHPAKQPPI
jgi:hypothetical protein